MATSPEMERRIHEFARELAEEFGGIEEREGECLMSSVEDFAAEIGDALAGRVMERELDSRWNEEDQCCPCCQRTGRMKRMRSRSLQTKRGVIEITEPEFYCSRCRKSFFPDVQEIGDDS